MNFDEFLDETRPFHSKLWDHVANVALACVDCRNFWVLEACSAH